MASQFQLKAIGIAKELGIEHFKASHGGGVVNMMFQKKVSTY